MPAMQHEIGRNGPCPCGSGNRFEKCRGVADALR